MLDAVLNPENLTNLPNLVKDIRKAITTDLGVNQAMDLACMRQEVGTVANLMTVRPPPYLVTIDAEDRMIPNVEGKRTLFDQMVGDN
jgi:hypothetical protein